MGKYVFFLFQEVMWINWTTNVSMIIIALWKLQCSGICWQLRDVWLLHSTTKYSFIIKGVQSSGKYVFW
jgi:hypothetical protein